MSHGMFYLEVVLKFRALAVPPMLYIRRHEYIPMRAHVMLLPIPVGHDKYFLFPACDTCGSYIRSLQF